MIIDAFGELRDQQEQVKEDMEVRHLWLGCGGAVGDALVPQGSLNSLEAAHNHCNPKILACREVLLHFGSWYGPSVLSIDHPPGTMYKDKSRVEQCRKMKEAIPNSLFNNWTST